jgi:hypothetical protein
LYQNIYPKLFIEYPEKVQDIKVNTRIIKEVIKESAKKVFMISGWQCRALPNVSVSHCPTLQTEIEKHFESEQQMCKVRGW